MSFAARRATRCLSVASRFLPVAPTSDEAFWSGLPARDIKRRRRVGFPRTAKTKSASQRGGCGVETSVGSLISTLLPHHPGLCNPASTVIFSRPKLRQVETTLNPTRKRLAPDKTRLPFPHPRLPHAGPTVGPTRRKLRPSKTKVRPREQRLLHPTNRDGATQKSLPTSSPTPQSNQRSLPTSSPTPQSDRRSLRTSGPTPQSERRSR